MEIENKSEANEAGALSQEFGPPHKASRLQKAVRLSFTAAVVIIALAGVIFASVIPRLKSRSEVRQETMDSAVGQSLRVLRCQSTSASDIRSFGHRWVRL